MLQVEAIETSDFTLIKFETTYDNKYFINGEEIKEFKEGWFKINDKLNKIEKLSKPKMVRRYYELKDKSFESEKIPTILEYNKVMICDDYDSCYYWCDEYKDYSSLYQEKKEYSKPKKIDLKFKTYKWTFYD